MDYNGPSMKPTLLPGDRLNIIPCSEADLKVGDVVVFEREVAQKVVHRVVKIGEFGVKTWGDNNSQMDPDILNLSEIKGRVISVKRRDRIISVQRGFTGQITGFLRRTKRRIDAALSERLHFFYYRLSRWGFLSKLLSIRMISFKRDNGIELQLLRHGKVIGRRVSGEKEWKIKRPYRLFVNVENLSEK